jgi:hypothetical protein
MTQQDHGVLLARCRAERQVFAGIVAVAFVLWVRRAYLWDVMEVFAWNSATVFRST